MRNCSKKNTVTHLIIMPFLPKVHITIPTSLAHGHSVQSYCNMEHLPAPTPLGGRQKCWGNRPPWCRGRTLGDGMAAPILPSKGGRSLPLYCLIGNSGSFVRLPLRTGELSAAGFLLYRLKDSPGRAVLNRHSQIS